MSRSLPTHCILESTFALIFLFLEQILQQETQIYTTLHNLHILFLLFLPLLDNNFILIGHSKQWVQSRRARGVLKIERYAQRLTHRARMGEASPYSWAPGLHTLPKASEHIRNNTTHESSQLPGG